MIPRVVLKRNVGNGGLPGLLDRSNAGSRSEGVADDAAAAEIEEILGNLGVSEESIKAKMSLLLEVGSGELIKVADLDVTDDVLRENGFAV